MICETIEFKAATECDTLRIRKVFFELLKELAPLGHDVLPTDHNLDLFDEHVWEPAIRSGQHGIFLATQDHECIGAILIVLEHTRIQVPCKRAIAHGAWVHPEHRRIGIALELQRQSHERLKELGVKEVISNVVANNLAGLASCRKAGAHIIGYMTTVYLGD